MKQAEHKHDHANAESCSACAVTIYQRPLPAPWVARVFDAMGVVFIAVAIVLFAVSWLTDETKFYIALCISFFVSGLLYTAAGEILRSCAETARNTAKLVELKELEIAKKEM